MPTLWLTSEQLTKTPLVGRYFEFRHRLNDDGVAVETESRMLSESEWHARQKAEPEGDDAP